MNENRLKKDRVNDPRLRTTILLGFLLRLLTLVLLLYVIKWDLYYLEDDKGFEELAGQYLYNSRGIIDRELFRELTRGWQSPFWAYVLGVSAKVFGSAYAPRYVNIVLSTICIGITYKLCYEVSGNQKTALTAARLYQTL